VGSSFRYREGEAPTQPCPKRSARAVGTTEGEIMPMEVAEGDEIIFSKSGYHRYLTERSLGGWGR